MAEEEVVAAASPAPSDHKRKLEDLEPEAPEHAESTRSEPDESNANLDLDGVENAEVIASDASDAKRPRLDDKTDSTVTENGYQAQKEDEPPKENAGQPAVDATEQRAMDNEEQPAMESAQSEDVQDASKESQEIEKNEELATGDPETDDTRQPSLENPELEETEIPAEEVRQPSADVPKEGDTSFAEEQPASDTETVSRKMDVPNNKVGVLIGKAGDTIRYLQYNSGAKIQITRDADADPYSTTRPVELIGSLANINKAEKLISDVIAEADAGGSPSLVARGFATAPAAGASEQIQIQVPNEKVGLIIGRGGETIKSLQTRSGARIQLIPQHLAEGDQSKERTVRVSGDKKQIEMARELIKEVMNQPVRPSPLSTGYNQQPYRQRGPSSHSQWGPRGPHPGQPSGYEYQQRGPYPSQHPQYPPQNYGNYPHHQQAPRSSFGSGWEQRPPANMQGPPHSGGYDYYGGPGGHVIDGPASAPHSAPIPSHGPGHNPAPAMGPPHSQANYNYGQPHGPDYGQPAPYSQTAPPQSYGHGYDEMKYENQAPAQHPYGGHGSSQPGYSQGGAQPGYGQQQQYGKPSYGMPAQGAPSQSYGPPRASQPGDYQGPVSSTQSYGQNVQQPYPYASSGPMQQTYQSYGSQPAPDGYNQPQVASGPGYPQQGGQPVPGYGQPGGQQAPGYAQGGAAAGYGAYPSSQPGYTEQPAANAGYGYQGTADPGYASGPGSAYAAPPSSQPGYAQAPTQPGYEQSVPQSGGYGSAPVGYGKSVSPQPQPGYPQYDSTQMYGAPR